MMFNKDTDALVMELEQLIYSAEEDCDGYFVYNAECMRKIRDCVDLLEYRFRIKPAIQQSVPQAEVPAAPTPG